MSIYKPLEDIAPDEWTRNKLLEMVCTSKGNTVSAIARQCDLNYQTVHSILSKGAEPKEKTVKRIAKGRGESMAEYYATEDEIVVKDSFELILIERFRKVSAERQLFILNLLATEN